jgi:uncharacterized protein (TIGR02145 family)
MKIQCIRKAKALLSVIVFGFFVSAFGQKPAITLTFTASKYGQHVPFDSILIKNLTQGTDTTLNAPDTVLMLDFVTGVDDHRSTENALLISQNYPNPIVEKTFVDINLSERAQTLITVNDIMGRELLRYEGQLDAGAHSFTFFPGMQSVYVLTARVNHKSQSIKMLNSPNNALHQENCKFIYNGSPDKLMEYKSVNIKESFVFNQGDRLRYTAYSENGEKTITDSPKENQTYTFMFDVVHPCPGMPTITDIDGNVYRTVLLGSQCWMASNLKTTTYSDNTPIPNVTSNDSWDNLAYGAYVWYNNDAGWKDLYGALYNWYAVDFYNGLCPGGWHVPTNEEWNILTDYIGGTEPPHGDELKSCRQVASPLPGECNTSDHPRWRHYNRLIYGTDDHGFSGLPAGYRYSYGPFAYLGRYTFFWASTETSANTAWYCGLYYDSSQIIQGGTFSKQNGFSVRCVRD